MKGSIFDTDSANEKNTDEDGGGAVGLVEIMRKIALIEPDNIRDIRVSQRERKDGEDAIFSDKYKELVIKIDYYESDAVKRIKKKVFDRQLEEIEDQLIALRGEKNKIEKLREEASDKDG